MRNSIAATRRLRTTILCSRNDDRSRAPRETEPPRVGNNHGGRGGRPARFLTHRTSRLGMVAAATLTVGMFILAVTTSPSGASLIPRSVLQKLLAPGAVLPGGKVSPTTPIRGFSLTPLRQPGTTRPPSSFTFSLQPGVTLASDAVVLANEETHSITFTIHADDGFNLPGTGALALRPNNEPKRFVGRWIALPVHELIVPARTQATIAFHVSTPGNAPPGWYVGGIVARAVTPVPLGSRGRVHVNVSLGEGVLVFARVLGPLDPGLRASNLSLHRSGGTKALLLGSGSARPTLEVANTGNTILDPVVHLSTAGGLVGGTDPARIPALHLSPLLPGFVVTVTLPSLRSLPDAGHFRLIATVSANGLTSTTSAGVWLVPYLAVMVLAVLLLSLALWSLLRRRKKRRRSVQPPGGGAQYPVTTMSRVSS